MVARRFIRPSYRRAIVVYMVAIVGPALVLLYLGWQSVQRQREAIAKLTISNLVLSGERLAEELERRAQQSAEECLRDSQLAQLPLRPANLDGPAAVSLARSLLAKVRSKHPVAGHFFVLQANTVLYPLVQTPLPRAREEDWAQVAPALRQQFQRLITQAESLELSRPTPLPALALTNYLQAFDLPFTNGSKALALARVARCRAALQQFEEAEAAWRSLMEQFGDHYTEHHRPYALIAALELADLAKAQKHPLPPAIAQTYRDMLQGRWELSAELLDFFKSELEKRLPQSPTRPPASEFLEHLGLARALALGFSHHGPLHVNEVYACPLSRGQNHYQLFYALHGIGHAPETLVGFAADLNWVQRQLLPECRRQLGLDKIACVMLAANGQPGGGATAAEARVAFKRVFAPFWALSVRREPGQAGPLQAQRDLLVFGGATLLIAGVLALGVLMLIRDVTREMQLNRLRSDFVAGVSHELKTPLTLIRLYGETLLYGDGFSSAERRSYYQIIARESERLSHLIENVLDFSRIERGRKQYRLQAGDLAPLIASTVAPYRDYLQRQGFTLRVDLATGLPPVRFDADAVTEAVLNLIDNAAKYSGESKLIAVRLRPEASRVIFEVEDHGVGIPEGERDRLFQQFYQPPQRREKGGYGLGLFLVKHIMDAHGGAVEVQSTVGQGSVFRLAFPTAAASELSAPTPKPETVPCTKS